MLFSNIAKAQTSFKRRTPEAVETAEAPKQAEIQDDYDRKRAEREEQRRKREEERRIRAEQRAQRGLTSTSRDSTRGGDASDEQETVDKDVLSKRGVVFSLESLGKNDDAVLSLGAVRDIMVGRLELLRNNRFSIGTVYEIDDNNAGVELITNEGALVQYLVVDRKNGNTYFALPDYKPDNITYNPRDMDITKEEADVLLTKLREYEQEIENRFGNMDKFLEYERLMEEEKEYLKTLEEYQGELDEDAAME